jgi:hypothetical protein
MVTSAGAVSANWMKPKNAMTRLPKSAVQHLLIFLAKQIIYQLIKGLERRIGVFASRDRPNGILV